jgi:hypothetical protein
VGEEFICDSNDTINAPNIMRMVRDKKKQPNKGDALQHFALFNFW